MEKHEFIPSLEGEQDQDPTFKARVTAVIESLKSLLEEGDTAQAKAALERLHPLLLDMVDMIEKRESVIDDLLKKLSD
jgi:hypothetical protein